MRYRLVSITVIVVTDNGEVSEEARAEGADEDLLRPINPKELIWDVDKLVT